MLHELFHPKAVAVIGASTKELSIGNRIIRNLKDFGYKGRIYPVNPKADEIRGIRAWPSIMDIDDTIDVAHIVIPPKFVPQAVEDCGRKGVKHVIINTGGFSETGPEGQALEKDFLERAKKYGVRIFGPNCQGIINTDPDVRAYCNFTFTIPEPGHISIVSLSGGVAELIHQELHQMGVGTRIYASNGNACDITIPEIIRYLGNDEGTRVIVLYVEGLKDPEGFMAAAREVAVKKPILAMKAGRTREGAKAASSHTGGLAKAEVATETIFKKTGILSFTDEGELCQAAAAFATQPVPEGKNVGMITNTGGPAVIATDILVSNGLKIPPLSEKSIQRLKEKLFAAASVDNPLDVLATGTSEHFRYAIDTMMEDERIDSVLLNFVTPFFVDTDSIAREIVDISKQGKKPLICNLMTDKKERKETVDILRKGGVPCYNLPGVAARALSAMEKYNTIRSRSISEIRTFQDIDRKKAELIMEKAVSAGRKMLRADEVFGLLDAYGITAASWNTAATVDEAVKAADQMGYPVVVKVDSESIIHKSDEGGVALNLMDAQAVRTAVDKMESIFSCHDRQYLIQKFHPGGMELIIGAKSEPGLGHLIMFGMGGVHVEVMKDVVFQLTPVTEIEAGEMLDSIQAAPLLKGFRGHKAIDRSCLTEMIQRFSQLVSDLPQIQEMDLNPAIGFEDRIVVADARISME